MAANKIIRRALISVFHKEGLEDLLRQLAASDVKFLSTGGTRDYIKSLGYDCDSVEDITTYPSILGGRVKTLHPKVFGGILARRAVESDNEELAKYEIPEIDLVVVDLYPFEQTVASGASEADIIEKIDIGGISVASRDEYGVLADIVRKGGATTTLEERRMLATHAFEVCRQYDTAISTWFAQK